MNNTRPAQITPYPNINELLHGLLQDIRKALGDKLVGLYLYGSLVTGDFDMDVSDIDLMAVTSSGINEDEFDRLDRLHQDFVNQHEEWDNHLEIAYVSVDALRTYKWRTSNIAVISPGEPFHLKEAGKDWLINWYVVRERGVALFGPSPEIIIEPIAKEEFIRAVAHQAREWRDWIERARTLPGLAYGILTMCRALYAYKYGEQASKKQAALWAQKELPEWASLIGNALAWRKAWRDDVEIPEATFVETRKFVRSVIDRIQ
jgi:predicted nucleotidyltransferase